MVLEGCMEDESAQVEDIELGEVDISVGCSVKVFAVM
jgi:hypothetical protein